MILIMAANGHIGRHLTERLVKAGLPVRACVRTEASGQALKALGVAEVVVGDATDPAILKDAMRGVDKVFHLSPTAHPKQQEMGFQWIDAAKAAGVRHFVLSTVLHAIWTPFLQHVLMRNVEEHLLDSGLEFTILQPTNFMVPIMLRSSFEHGVFVNAWTLERRQSLVDVADIAEVAAMALTDSEKHAAATYELVSPGRYNAYDLGGIVQQVTGKPIQVQEISPDDLIQGFFGGKPEDFPHEAKIFRAILAQHCKADFVGNPNVLTWLLGRTPTTWEQFVRREYAAFQKGATLTPSHSR